MTLLELLSAPAVTGLVSPHLGLRPPERRVAVVVMVRRVGAELLSLVVKARVMVMRRVGAGLFPLVVGVGVIVLVIHGPGLLAQRKYPRLSQNAYAFCP